jgi:probable HAF family extracellular repeat protein
MTSRTTRLSRRSLGLMMFLLAAGLGGPSAFADPLYTIKDLGTLPGQTSSVATAINNQGQVVGISYNSSDGNFASGLTGVETPPRFHSTGPGAQSFLFSGGQITQISPIGGLAMSINDSSQVVGGPNASINNSGQYVAGAYSGIDSGDFQISSHVTSGTTTTALPALFDPYAINNSGQIAGSLTINAHGGSDTHPAIYQNGQLTDLFSKIGSGQYYGSAAIAINQKGDMLINVSPPDNSLHSYLYNASAGKATELSALPGGSGMIAAALNNSDQAVGKGSLYSNGVVKALASLISSGTGWSNLNATGINDAGQIVGQGLIDGQEHAFEMSPSALETPEPGALAVWGFVSAYLGARMIAR